MAIMAMCLQNSLKLSYVDIIYYKLGNRTALEFVDIDKKPSQFNSKKR